MNLTNQQLVFVTGKGGVGKSVAAASIAWSEARKGKRVCLVELGSQSFYESFFEIRGIAYDPSELVPDVHIALFTPEDCLKEYVLHYVKVKQLYEIFFQNKVMRAFLNAAPALAELSILGKLTGALRGIIKSDYDLFVVDCFSTGHALALFRAPFGLSTVFKSGPLYEQSRDISKILTDPQLTHYVLVTLAEEMPVVETGELISQMRSELKCEPTLICNKLLNPPLTLDQRNQLSLAENDVTMKKFLDYLAFKEKSQNMQLQAIKGFAHSFYGVPIILNATSGQDYVEQFAKGLEKLYGI